jgi:hypothetical protein
MGKIPHYVNKQCLDHDTSFVLTLRCLHWQSEREEEQSNIEKCNQELRILIERNNELYMLNDEH